MRELDFDFGTGQDAGRALYRGLFIYGGLLGFKNILAQVDSRINLFSKFVETELWRTSRCFVAMKPRLRLFYSAMVCSFVPFCSRQISTRQFGF